MDLRIEMVDPLAAAEPAGTILRTAWKPPCLHYSTPYLAWQFSFPGALEPKVAIAYREGRPVGCASVTQRAFMLDGSRVDAYVLSFVAVDPIARGHGVAAAVYAALLDTISADIPVLAFAEPDSPGERLLLTAFTRAGFDRHVLEPCRAVGYLQRANAPPTEQVIYAAMTTDFEEYTSAAPLGDRKTAWNYPTRQQWDHYLSDPRPRLMFAIRNANGVIEGSAIMVMAEILSAQGIQIVPMLESVCLSSPSAEALRSVFRVAAERSHAPTTIVASNLSFIDGAVIRAAGARALPSAFNCYVFVKSVFRSFAKITNVNLEVI